MKPGGMMEMYFEPETEVDIYIHGKDEQYYLHWDWWPKRPFLYHLRPYKYTLVELSIKKDIESKDGRCNDKEDTKYFGKDLKHIMTPI